MSKNTLNKELLQQLQHVMAADQRRLRSWLKRLAAVSQDNPEWLRFNQALEKSAQQYQQRVEAVPALTYPSELPVSQERAQIIAALRQHQVVVVAGETGSGKTTQLPKICLEIGRGISGYIGHTQPRRVAARTVAARIAEELKSPLEKYAGYKVRFTDQTSADAYIKLMTDGILLAELQQDRFLSRYDTLIIDEAHERSLNIDFILGYLKQLLPRRPDLKIIITSATLEPGRFASYFNQAPIVTVSGRTYPVEIVYKPFAEEQEQQDQITGIITAVNELIDHGPGDILIFLSGEREIHDTAAALRKQHLTQTDILPLYSRLSVSEQNKVFHPSGQRRIVLATNVAETSITVPGIRYVIDPGLARIKRYSYRSKIQRLPIEPISQASAKQRAGRCGRIGPGICIRLYAQQDLLARPEFTEPEILRSNLASVILQMVSLQLGDIKQFPFINPPDSRLIRDGYKVLEEIAAIKPDKTLTEIGKRLAKLPLDPRLGRMLLAAEKEGCVEEILIIVSGLSIQDPRERPKDWQQAADEKHRIFADERSDFLSFLNLWDVLKLQQQQQSNNQFRQFCRDNFLSYLRVREWHDVYSQLREAVSELKLRRNQVAADYTAIHRAILTGLLNQIGCKQEDGIYLGTRNIKFAIFPGSSVFKKKPKWLMAMEVVETAKLYARVTAQIEPEWVEQVGNHLIKRSYFEPHWEKRRNQVVALEKKLLYGLVINPGKKVNYGPHDPKLCREIFIREALVQGDYVTDAAFFQHNLQLLAELDELEHKSRRRDLMVDEQTLFDFYNEFLPLQIYDGVMLAQWLKAADEQQQAALFLTKDYLIAQNQVADIAEQFPESVVVSNHRLKLEYRFEPGHAADGVTAIIPIAILNQLADWQFDWVVPGLIKEKMIAAIKSLPKSFRRSFVPAINYAEACLNSFTAQDRQAPVITAMTKQLKRITGIDIPDSAWDITAIPENMLMNYRVVDNTDTVLAEGRNLEQLRQQLAGKVQAHLQTLPTQQWEREQVTHWDFGDLPPSITIDRDGLAMTAYPAIIAQHEHVALRLMADKTLAQQATYFGLRKLFALALAKEINFFKKSTNLKVIAAFYIPEGTAADLIAMIINAAIQELFLQDHTHIRTQSQFEAALNTQRSQFLTQANAISNLLMQCYELQRDIKQKLKGVPASVKENIEQQLQQLLQPGFIEQTPCHWLQRFPLYLKAINIRINKVGGNINRDLQYSSELKSLWQLYQNHLKAHPQCSNRLVEYRYLLEEYRISLFAQELKTVQPVSKSRLEKRWQEHLAQCK